MCNFFFSKHCGQKVSLLYYCWVFLPAKVVCSFFFLLSSFLTFLFPRPLPSVCTPCQVCGATRMPHGCIITQKKISKFPHLSSLPEQNFAASFSFDWSGPIDVLNMTCFLTPRRVLEQLQRLCKWTLHSCFYKKKVYKTPIQRFGKWALHFY
jgi:hypothetical protein